MKVILSLCFSYLIGLGTVSAGDLISGALRDSIVVKFGENTRIVILGENRGELEKLLEYDLNKLLRELRITIDDTSSDTTIIYREVDGSVYLTNRDAVDQNYIRIGSRGKSQSSSVRIELNEEVNYEIESETAVQTKTKSKARFYRSSVGTSPRKGFEFGIGFNNYGTNQAGDNYNRNDYNLNSFGSRYVKLGYVATAAIVRGKKARLHLDFGADFSWYNLMFSGNTTIIKQDDRAVFEPVTDNSGNDLDLRKSKLVLPYANLSLMPTLSFPHAFITYVSAGMYGGYRLGGYTKIRAEGSKDVTHDRKDFFANELRYGMAAEVGVRNFLKLFVQYDINEVFKTNRGPQIRMISFGVKI